MLNISKISKMLLVSGLVLAFSCATLNVSPAYANECSKARNELKKAQKEKIDLSSEQAAYDKAVKEKGFASNDVAAAKQNCATELQYCSEYQSAQTKLKTAEDNVTKAKKALDDAKKTKEQARSEKIKSAEAKVVSACGAVKDNEDAKANADNEENQSNANQTRKQKKAADQANQAKNNANNTYNQAVSDQEKAYEEWNEAEIANNNAQKAYNDQKTKTEQAQKAMQNACAGNTSSQACKDAQKAYADASNDLNQLGADAQAAQSTLNTAESNKNKAERAVDTASGQVQQANQEDQARALHEVTTAQQNVDRYCTPGTKTYNKNKCNKAEQALTAAKADETYKQAMEEKNRYQELQNSKAEEERQGQLNEIGANASNAKDAYVSSEDLENLQNEADRLEGSKADADARLKELEQARDAACVKPKSKACKNAQAAYQSQKDTVDLIQGKLDNANNQLNNASDANAAVMQQVEACQADPSKPGCAELLKTHASDQKDSAKRSADEASKNLSEAKGNLSAAENSYNEALNAQALACGSDPSSQECADATAALEGAQKAKDDAKAALNEAQSASSSANSALLNTMNQEKNAIAGEKEAIYNDLEQKAKAACDKVTASPGSVDILAKAECDSLTQQAKDAKIEMLQAKKNAACTALDEDSESEDGLSEDASPACRTAHNALNGYIESEAQAEEDEARRQRENNADIICEQKGENSPECIQARAAVGDPSAAGKRMVLTEHEPVRETGFNYTSSANGDVFEIVTRRAANILLGIKPIVYIFAGFGLIGFAWGAIFNKISWKHFANISIGLFLVANMGRLIEYFVTNSEDGNYYIGQWESSTPKKDKSNELSAAFGDTYHIYSYEMVDAPLNTGGEAVDTARSQLEANAATPKEDEGKSEGAIAEVGKMTNKERGYCEGTSGSGWGNFKSCVKDVAGSIQKAANVVTATTATISHVANRVEDSKNAVKDIKNAVQNMKNGNILGGLGAIVNNVGRIGGAATSAGGAVVLGGNKVVDSLSTIGSANKNQGGSLIGTLNEGLSAAGAISGAFGNR